MKEKILIICPGRGTYTKESLGYFRQFQQNPSIRSFIQRVDKYREESGYRSVSNLDGESNFSVPLHTPGENASTLIYTCALADFMSIDRDRFDVVAVTGNSMGWYLALSCAAALDESGSYQVIQTMGAMMKEKIIGGQIIYPIMDEQWQIDPAKEQQVFSIMDKINQLPGHHSYVSIYLGGYLVLAGNTQTLNQLQKDLPSIEHYPFKLVNHAAFHTPLLQETSQAAFQQISANIFHPPEVPLIDGRGKIWMPYSTDIEELYDYTLGHQVVAPYDFTTGLSVAIKEFAPTKLVLLGPGNSLGGVIGQVLIQNRWQKIASKKDFVNRQKEDPILYSMGIPEQRSKCVR